MGADDARRFDDETPPWQERPGSAPADLNGRRAAPPRAAREGASRPPRHFRRISLEADVGTTSENERCQGTVANGKTLELLHACPFHDDLERLVQPTKGPLRRC